MNKWLLSLIFATLPGPSLLAQTSSDMVRFPSGNAVWIVDISYTDESAEASGTSLPPGVPKLPLRPKRIEVARIEPSERFRITWSDKSTSEIWRVKNYTLTEDPVSHFIDVERGFPNSTSELIRLDEFAWIHVGTAVQRVYLNGKQCLLFEMVSGALRQAWCDSATFLPIAYKDQNVHDQFTFLAAPAEPLIMPQQFQTALDNYASTTTRPPPWFKP